jgi:hypothetical protein
MEIAIAIARHTVGKEKEETLTSTRLEPRDSIANNVASIILLLSNSLSLQSHSRGILSASQSQRRDGSFGRKRKGEKLGSCRSHMATATTGKGQEVRAVGGR